MDVCRLTVFLGPHTTTARQRYHPGKHLRYVLLTTLSLVHHVIILG